MSIIGYGTSCMLESITDIDKTRYQAEPVVALTYLPTYIKIPV